MRRGRMMVSKASHRTIAKRAIPTTPTTDRMTRKLADLGQLGGVPRGFASVSSASSFRVARRLRVGPFRVSGRSAARLARLVRGQEVGGSNPLAPTCQLRSIPDTWVTVYSEHIGNTLEPK